MTEKTEVISGRIPLGKWQEICKKYGVQGDNKSEQFKNLILKLLSTDTFTATNVAQKTPNQSIQTQPPITPSSLNTTPQSVQPHIMQNPFDILRTYPPCPHNTRQVETNIGVIFCAKDLNPPITDRKIEYHKVTIERCKLCIENLERQKSINEAKEEQKRKADRDYEGKPLTKRYMGDT